MNQLTRKWYFLLASLLGLLLFNPANTCYADDEPATSAQSAAVTPTPASSQQTSTLADASSAPAASDDFATPDPYEKFNRHMFNFNDLLDRYVLKPIATVYNKIVPTPINRGIHNVFLNIGNLPTIANDLLQFNFYQAANDTWRLAVNTTLGIGGLFDVGSRIGLMPYSNDFGITLYDWGYKNSNYLVLPFFGPSNFRDGIIGLPVDYYGFSIYPWIHPLWARYTVYGVGVVDRRAQLLQFQNVLDEASLDQYSFIRNAYLQHRAYQMEQNQHLGYKEHAPVKANAAEVQEGLAVEAAETVAPAL